MADALEEAMREGRWSEGLPGYRVIAENFGVSRRTSQQALRVLAERGLVGPAKKGQPRQVLHAGTEDILSRQVMLVITSSKVPADAGEQELLDDLIMIWVEQGGEVRRAQIDYRQRKQPDTALRKLVSDHSASVVLMREPGRPWVAAAQRLPEPAYFLGGDIPRDDFSKVSGFAVSIFEMVSQAVVRLRAQGHQRIMMPDEGRGVMFRQSVLAAMKRSWGEDSCKTDNALCCPEFSELEPEAWQRYWQDSLRRARPTAVIVHKETSFFSLLSYCFGRKLRIPEDLSVICLAASENLLWCHPVPDHVTFPKAKALTHFRRWIRGGFKATGFALLPVKFVEGSSTQNIRSGYVNK